MTVDNFGNLPTQHSYAACPAALRVSTFVAVLSQFIDERFTPEKIQVLKRIELQSLMYTETSLNWLTSVHIILRNTEVVVCIDAALAEYFDKSSQTGVLAIFSSKTSGAVNTICYVFRKSKPMYGSILAGQLFGSVYGYYFDYKIAHTTQKMLVGNIDVKCTLTVYLSTVCDYYWPAHQNRNYKYIWQLNANHTKDRKCSIS